MIILPIAIVGPPEAPELTPPARRTPLLWALIGLLVGWAVVETVAIAAAVHGWAWLPAVLVRAVTIASASAQLYPAHDLFLPHQLWTAALVHDGIDPTRLGGVVLGAWQIIAGMVVLTVAGRAVERQLGSLATAAALLVLLPLAALIHLRAADSGSAIACASDLVAGVAGLAWGLFAGHRVRWAVYYWLVVVVGVRPFRLHLRWLALGFVAQEAARAFLAMPAAVAWERVFGVLAAAVVGHGLGTAARLLQRGGMFAAQ